MEIASKRQHQSVISHSVALLTACLTHIAQTTAPSGGAVILGQVSGTQGHANGAQGQVKTGLQPVEAEVGPVKARTGPVKAGTGPLKLGFWPNAPSNAEDGQDLVAAGKLVLPVLEVLSTPQELKLHVMTACQLVDRGVGSRIAIAANQGECYTTYYSNVHASHKVCAC